MNPVLVELKKLRAQAEGVPERFVKDVTTNSYRAGYRAGYLDACDEAIQIVEELEEAE